jgi:hypothetical protein
VQNNNVLSEHPQIASDAVWDCWFLIEYRIWSPPRGSKLPHPGAHFFATASLSAATITERSGVGHSRGHSARQVRMTSSDFFGK